MHKEQNLLSQTRRLIKYYQAPAAWFTTRLVLATAAVSVAWLIFFPSYEAVSTVTALPSRAEIGFTSRRGDFWGLSPSAVLTQTHREFLLSRGVAEGAARVLREEMGNNGAAPLVVKVGRGLLGGVTRVVFGITALLDHGRWRWPDAAEVLTRRLERSVTVTPLPGSYIMRVSVRWNDRNFAARAANLVTEQYIAAINAANREQLTATRRRLEEQIAQAHAQCDEIETRIQSYKETSKVYAGTRDVVLKMEEMSRFLQDYNETQVDLAELDSSLQALKDFRAPAALAADQARRAGLEARRKGLEQVLADYSKEMETYPVVEKDLRDLFRQKDERTAELASLRSALVQTRIGEAAEMAVVRVVDRALPPDYPARPRALVNTLAAVLVGLVLSGGYALAREYQGGFLRAPAEATLTGCAPAFVVPDEQAFGSRAVEQHVRHMTAEMMRSGRVVALCSAAGGEGKTYLAERLARAAAAANRRVLLVDGSAGRPRLHHVFGKPAQPGLKDVLDRKAPPADCVLEAGARLSVMPAGAEGAADPVEPAAPALASLSGLFGNYDLVIIDGDALRAEPAATRLWPLADTMLCVFDATTSRRSDLEDVARRLQGAKSEARIVLNRVKLADDLQFAS